MAVALAAEGTNKTTHASAPEAKTAQRGVNGRVEKTYGGVDLRRYEEGTE
jgi:hypothetical protein